MTVSVDGRFQVLLLYICQQTLLNTLPIATATHGVRWFRPLGASVVTVVRGLGLVTLDMPFSRLHDTASFRVYKPRTAHYCIAPTNHVRALGIEPRPPAWKATDKWANDLPKCGGVVICSLISSPSRRRPGFDPQYTDMISRCNTIVCRP